MTASDRSANRVVAAPGLLIRHWGDEETGVAFVPGLARTHLVSAEAAELLQACLSAPEGFDSSAPLWPQATLDGLLDAGLLQRMP